jgi:hypothetical protein
MFYYYNYQHCKNNVDSPDFEELNLSEFLSSPPAPTPTEELKSLVLKHENYRITDHEAFTKAAWGVAGMTTANKLLSAKVDEITAVEEQR